MRVAANRGEAALSFSRSSRAVSHGLNAPRRLPSPPLPRPLMAGVAAHNARCTLLGFTIIRADASLRMASQISSHDRVIFNFRSDNYLQLLRTLIASSPRGGEPRLERSRVPRFRPECRSHRARLFFPSEFPAYERKTARHAHHPGPRADVICTCGALKVSPRYDAEQSERAL